MRIMLCAAVAVALIAAACSSDGEPEAAPTATTVTTTTRAPSTTSSSTTSSTTTSSTTTSTTRPPPPSTTTVPPKYPVEAGWVMETILAEFDAATGGLAVDGEGNLYHADFGAGSDLPGDVVYKITPGGEVTEFSRPEGLRRATGNKFGPDGTLYQSSFGSGHVFRIQPDGSWDVLTDQLAGPTGLVITDEGRVFVEDCSLNTLNEVFPDGSFEVLLEEGLSCPNGMTMDDDGALYLSNFNNGILLRFVPDGDGSAEELVRLSSPINHLVHFEGSLFLVARNDLRIYRYVIATGELTTIAGTGTLGLGDGPAAAAQMGRPNAIAVDADGTLYINHSERRTGNDPVWIRRLSRVS